MKTNILRHSIAALLLAALPLALAEDDKKADEKNETKSTTSTVISSADGTATVTIDINGKKETRTFKLGDGNNVFTFGKDGNGVKAAGGAFMKPGGKREKGPWIGIAMEPVQDVVRAQLPLSPGEGILVGHVAPDSPAAKAGLQANDILVRFEDQIVVEPAQLRKLIAMKKQGDTVKLAFLRKGERKEADVTLVEHEVEVEYSPAQWFQGTPGVFTMPIPAPGAKMGEGFERMQDKLRQLKEKHPGVIVDKRAWISGETEQMLKGGFKDKIRDVLKESNLPKDEVEKILKQLDHAIKEAARPAEKEKPEPKKKPGETL